jgi:hypothetical protein
MDPRIALHFLYNIIATHNFSHRHGIDLLIHISVLAPWISCAFAFRSIPFQSELGSKHQAEQEEFNFKGNIYGPEK